MKSSSESIPTYRNTQSGTVLRIIMVSMLVMFLVIGFSSSPWMIPTTILLIILIATFHSLTTEVHEDSIVIWFGIGLIRRTIPISRIEGCSVARTPWYVGWGIRLLPGGGWLWNVSGFESVELSYVAGGRFRIGTDQPEELSAAITSVIMSENDTDPA